MSLAQDIAILQKVPMLSDFADEQLRLLAFSAESADFSDGQLLFDEGDRADGALLVADGEVALQKKRAKKTFEDVDVAGPGTLLGESALLVEAIRPCRAVAIGDVRVIRIRRALFKRMIMEFPELARRLFEVQAARFQTTASALAPIGERMAELEKISQSRGLRGTKDG